MPLVLHGHKLEFRTNESQDAAVALGFRRVVRPKSLRLTNANYKYFVSCYGSVFIPSSHWLCGTPRSLPSLALYFLLLFEGFPSVNKPLFCLRFRLVIPRERTNCGPPRELINITTTLIEPPTILCSPALDAAASTISPCRIPLPAFHWPVTRSSAPPIQICRLTSNSVLQLFSPG